MTHEKQLDLALQDFHLGQTPSRDENGRRINTIGENAQLDSFLPEIESYKRELYYIDIENVSQRELVSSIYNHFTDEKKKYDEAIKPHDNKIVKIGNELYEGKNEEIRHPKETTDITKESQKLKTGSKKKKGSSMLLLLLVTLGLETITFASTYTLQLEALSGVEVFMRFIYVLAIFCISILLHWLHKRNGNKLVQAMLISTIALSLVTMFHVIYISLNIQESPVAIDFSFGNEQGTTNADSFLNKIIYHPGLAEMMLAAFFCITGVICDIIGNKTDSAGNVQEKPQEQSYCNISLNETRAKNERMEKEIIFEQTEKDKINKTYLICLLEILDQLSIIKETIAKKIEERSNIRKQLKNSYQKQLLIMCQDRCMRKRMLHDMKDIPESEIVYEEWTLDDIKHYYNND